MKKIRRILIANRGEIALRIMRTAREMGIECVAIFEKEDKDSPYVRAASSAYGLTNGFLDQSEIIEIARKAQADAIHPGYGFLSENAAFVRAVDEAQIIFVGPSAKSMDLMGEKTAARTAAKAAQVPLLPGHEIEDATELSQSQRQRLVMDVGLPVVLKAAAGGGGKAQAIILEESEIAAAFDKVIREADRLYKSKSVVLERYLRKARHIEVQILGNAHGENYALFDRDCSAQRNNQKIIEEAPAPGLSEQNRRDLHASAVRLANHVGYQNAGTMEYLYDPQRDEFYFLEMNTRLQVEHTVTEMVTGLDLVREQILIAEGHAKDYSNITISGHAIQARICAEKSDGTYLPSTGKITQYIEPKNARVDSGVILGSVISGKYDNMVAKVIVHADTRDAAIRGLHQSIGSYIINGIHTNIPLLQKLLVDSHFQECRHFTRYLQEEFVPPESNPATAVSALAILLYDIEHQATRRQHGDLTGFGNIGPGT
jgi:acetyl-CoA carboxylase, biotin carboxylase subunit